MNPVAGKSGFFAGSTVDREGRSAYDNFRELK